MSVRASPSVSSHPPPPPPAPGARGEQQSEAALARPLSPWLRWLGAIGGSVAVLVAGARLAPAIAMPPLLAYVVGFIAVCGSVLLTAAACPRPRRWSLAVAVLPALSLLLLSLRSAGGDPLSDAVAVTACLLIVTGSLGSVVGGSIEHPGQLLFVAIVSSAADVFSVFHTAGPTQAIVQSEAALSVLALPWPMLGTPFIEPFLGAGDAVFTALYVSASRKHALPLARTLGALALAYGVTMGAVLWLQTTVPALPFLGLSMVLAHGPARRPTAADRRRGTWISVLIVAVVAMLFLF